MSEKGKFAKIETRIKRKNIFFVYPLKKLDFYYKTSLATCSFNGHLVK